MLPTYRTRCLATTLCLLLAIAGQADAQFTTVLNIPNPDANIGNNDSIDSDTQLNLSSGGEIGYGFDAGNFDGTSENVEVNITGGDTGRYFNAYGGSEVNIFGGTVDSSFEAYEGSEVSISGGSVDYLFHALSGSSVKLLGGEFYLDGMLVSGLETIGNQIAIEIAFDSTLNGTYMDGTPFHFSSTKRDSFALGTLTLEATGLPSFAPEVVNVTTNSPLSFARRNQTVVVQEGGTLDSYFSAGQGSIVNIQAGTVDNAFNAFGSEVNISGGTLGNISASFGSVVSISGGTISGGLRAHNGSEVNISGGSVGEEFNAFSGSMVNISGGSVGGNFNAYDGSVVNVSGGIVGDNFQALAGSVVNISGGNIGNQFWATGSVVNISGGNFGYEFTAYQNSEVNITGGSLEIVAYAGSVINIAGGNIGRVSLGIASEVNISGGSVGDYFHAGSGSLVNLTGTDFLLDGLAIDGLAAETTVTIDIANRSLLTGTLANGAAFDFDTFFPNSYFSSSSTLTVTLLPSDFLAGDYNGDGQVDAADYTVWQDSVGQDSDALANNFHSGIIGQPEYDTWVENYGRVLTGTDTTAVPEPTTATLLLALLTTTAGCTRRSAVS